ncbi:hypothetical protein CR513_58934, partial [Mucuna pruriens]
MTSSIGDLQPSSLVVHEVKLRNDINVYLSPLVEDLRLLWDEGIDMFDGYNNQNFKMRAMLFYTINDFSVYGNLFGYSVKGHKACHICEKTTSYYQLTKKEDILKKAFNECQGNDVVPRALTRDEAQRQPWTYECRLYVTKHLLNIVFNDNTVPFLEEEIDDIRRLFSVG